MSKGKVSRVFVWVILGLLFVGLAGFGATNFGGGLRALGSVGDTDITVDDYARELQQELRAIAAQTGRAVPIAEAQAAGIDRMVLGRLVARAALDDETARIGLSVGDEEVGRQVLEIPAFRGLDGGFDREAYAFTLEQAGLTVAEFEERVRGDTARQLVQAAVTAGTALPPVYTDTLYAWAREEREITWALLGLDDLADPLPAPTAAELAAFHAANEALFTRPETRAITYAWLTPDMVLETIESDEALLRALYQDRIGEYVVPERRLVERLVFGTEEEAADALARIEAGTDSFDDLVAERGLTLDDVDLGDVARDELGAAAEAVFALAEPGVVGPYPTGLGPALFRMNAVLSAQETTFEEAREELEAEYAADRARRVIADMMGPIDDLLAGGATLEELAAETEMELGRIDWNRDVDSGIAAYASFREAAAAAEPGDFPELVEMDEGGVFAFRIDEVRPPELIPLAEVEAEVAEAWAAEEAGLLLVAEAEAAAEAIRGGAEMAGLGLPLRSERGLMRDSFLDDAPAGLLEAVFAMEPGEVRVLPAPGGAALVRLDRVLAADQDAPEALALKAAFSEQTAQELAGDLLDLYTRAVQARAGIAIDPQAVAAVHAQLP